MTNHRHSQDFLRLPNILLLADVPVYGLWFASSGCPQCLPLLSPVLHHCWGITLLYLWVLRFMDFTRRSIWDRRLETSACGFARLLTPYLSDEERAARSQPFIQNHQLCLLPVNIVAGLARPSFSLALQKSRQARFSCPAGVMLFFLRPWSHQTYILTPQWFSFRLPKSRFCSLWVCKAVPYRMHGRFFGVQQHRRRQNLAALYYSKESSDKLNTWPSSHDYQSKSIQMQCTYELVVIS